MSKVLVKGGVQHPFYQGLIEVDCDPEAEHVIIIDRDPTKYSRRVEAKTLVKVIVPLDYGNKNDLIVGITDADRTYATKFADGVKAQIIDGVITDISK